MSRRVCLVRGRAEAVTAGAELTADGLAGRAVWQGRCYRFARGGGGCWLRCLAINCGGDRRRALGRFAHLNAGFTDPLTPFGLRAVAVAGEHRTRGW